jgi:hypothetical protein
MQHPWTSNNEKPSSPLAEVRVEDCLLGDMALMKGTQLKIIPGEVGAEEIHNPLLLLKCWQGCGETEILYTLGGNAN